MTAEIVPFGEMTLCSCGFGIACVPIYGGIVCRECADFLREQRTLSSVTEIMCSPVESTTLDDLLAKLVQP